MGLSQDPGQAGKDQAASYVTTAFGGPVTTSGNARQRQISIVV